ncbi:MAG: hypothetical protein ACFB4I_07505 [Cyanophyceae cyanobacterium]
MSSNTSPGDRPLTNTLLCVAKLRNSVWSLGIPSWLFGITDRSIAALGDGYISPIEILHILIGTFFFVSWLYLKPEELDNTNSTDSVSLTHQQYWQLAHSRMLELQQFHLIRQEYLLPFPYFCQIYHLLNLKHLETVHAFSLNNLRIIEVGQFQATAAGGKLKFQTLLDSPVNALRIWRQPIVEVELVLHTPYTVELKIPVYNGKKITVIFNVIPLGANEHKFLIDIYSDLSWPKPFLQLVLHFASCLTLWEDLPYLRKLATRRSLRLVAAHPSNHDTMRLFRRFVDLYGEAPLAGEKGKSFLRDGERRNSEQ